jgi:hypothetical protein
MKIKRFEEINESSDNDIYYLFLEHDNYDNHYLFDNYENACIFLLRKIYYVCADEHLDEVDEMTSTMNIDEIFEYYNEIRDVYKELNQISYDEISLIKQIKLDDSTQLRIDSKKYNM